MRMIRRLGSKTAVCLPHPQTLVDQVTHRFKPSITTAKVGLPADMLADVLGEYDFSLQSSPLLLKNDTRSETYLLHTSRGKKILKRYRQVITEPQITFEHAILNHLEAQAFPAVRLFSTRQNETLVEKSGRFYGVYDFLTDYHHFDEHFFFPPQTDWFLYEKGRLLGRLHQALKHCEPAGYSQFVHPPGPDYPAKKKGGAPLRDLHWYLGTLRHSIEAAQAPSAPPADPINARMVDAAAWIEDELQALDAELEAAEIGWQVIHGDFGPYNLLVNPAASNSTEHHEPIVVIDFELAHWKWPLYDLINAYSTCTHNDSHVQRCKKIERITAGYQATNPISPAEFRYLPLIWRYHLLQRLVTAWSHYLTHPKGGWGSEIRKRFAQMDWVMRNQEVLVNLGEMVSVAT